MKNRYFLIRNHCVVSEIQVPEGFTIIEKHKHLIDTVEVLQADGYIKINNNDFMRLFF